MTIGERIKVSRESFGYSQVELADKIGVSKQSLYKYENNIITNIPSDKIELIADVLNIQPSYLMGWNVADTTIEDNTYYLNADARDMAQFMFSNPEYKVLFDATKKVKKEDIEFVKQMIDRMGNTNDDTGC